MDSLKNPFTHGHDGANIKNTYCLGEMSMMIVFTHNYVGII